MIPRTGHHHMQRKTEIDNIYFRHSLCHFRLILYIKISIRLHIITQIEDCVTKHDAEDWIVLTPVWHLPLTTPEHPSILYMLLFVHISHLLDHIYQYLWYGYCNDSVHHEHDHDLMSDLGYLAALFISMIYITPCAGICKSFPCHVHSYCNSTEVMGMSKLII